MLGLSDGSLALVVRASRDRAGWAHPVVRVVRSGDGTFPEGRTAIDLQDGRVGLEVLGVMEPALAGPGIVAAGQAILATANA